LSKVVKFITISVSLTFTLIIFQNCGSGFDSLATDNRSLASVNDDPSPLRKTCEEIRSDLIPRKSNTIANLPFLPNTAQETWGLEWSDEFEGPRGSRPGSPWNFFDGYGDTTDGTWRDAFYTEEDAFLDGESHLVMRALVRNGRPETSYLRSTSDDTGENFMSPTPENLVLDPGYGPLYIEISGRFDNAFQSEDAWWAFWLFGSDTSANGTKHSAFDFPCVPNLSSYDGNAQTGMEVDIFEYVPYLGPGEFNSRNGGNLAAFIDLQTAMHVPDIDNVVFNGFIGDFNNYLRSTNRDPNPNIQLSDGQYHTIGLYWDTNSYKFFIDQTEIWEITDPRFITQTRANSIILSWEVGNGVWEGNSNLAKTFVSENTNVQVLLDYVRVYRRSPLE